jgi:hypothetical protein
LIRVTVLSARLATQTAPAPTAILSGASPTVIVLVGGAPFGSIRDTVPSPSLVTHRLP